MLAVCLPITSTPWVFLKSLGQRRNSTLLEDSFPEFSLTHRGSYSGNLKPGMEFGMKILRTFLPPIATEQTTVPTSGLRRLNLRELGWNEKQPSEMESQTDGRHGAVSPFGNKAAADTPEPLPRCPAAPRAP